MLAKDLAMGTDDGPDAQPADESRLGKLVRLLALMRIALFLTFVLFWLALLSGSISMFQNLFEEQMGFWGATLVSITAFMAGWLAMALVFIVIELGPHRFDFPNVKVPVWFSKWRVAIFAIPAFAIIGRLWRQSPGMCDVPSWTCSSPIVLGSIFGFLIAFGILYALTVLYHWLVPSNVEHKQFLLSPELVRDDIKTANPLSRHPRMTGIVSKVAPGAISAKTDQPYAQHLVIWFIIILLWAGYFVFGYGGGYILIRYHYLEFLPPVLAFVLLLLISVALTLSAIAFWFDAWRVPVILAVALFSMLI